MPYTIKGGIKLGPDADMKEVSRKLSKAGVVVKTPFEATGFKSSKTPELARNMDLDVKKQKPEPKPEPAPTVKAVAKKPKEASKPKPKKTIREKLTGKKSKHHKS